MIKTKLKKTLAISVLIPAGNKERLLYLLPLGRGKEGWGWNVQYVAVCLGVAFEFLILSFLNLAVAGTLQGPALGQPATPEQIAQWDIGIMPDGEGLPAGSGNAVQGKSVYDKHCVSCHGPAGIGGSALQLAGAQMPLTSDYPELTIGSYWPYATTVFDMVRRSMPMNAPGTLTDDEVYAVTAYLLYINNIIGEPDEMNAGSLPKVSMPNRNGFINIYEQENSVNAK